MQIMTGIMVDAYFVHKNSLMSSENDMHFDN